MTVKKDRFFAPAFKFPENDRSSSSRHYVSAEASLAQHFVYQLRTFLYSQMLSSNGWLGYQFGKFCNAGIQMSVKVRAQFVEIVCFHSLFLYLEKNPVSQEIE
jgi:hypothetical protein